MIVINNEQDCAQNGVSEEHIIFHDGCETEWKRIETESTHPAAVLEKNNENEKLKVLATKDEDKIDRNRKRRESHNNVERRRRYTINDQIKELTALLPKSVSQGMSLNKGSILNATVEYVKSLKKSEKESMNLIQIQAMDHAIKQRISRRLFELELQMKLSSLKEDVVSRSYRTHVKRCSSNFEEFVEKLFKDIPFGQKPCSQCCVCTDYDTAVPSVTRKKTFRRSLSKASGRHTQRLQSPKKDPNICKKVFRKGRKRMPKCKKNDTGLTILEVKDDFKQIESKKNGSFDASMGYNETKPDQGFIINDQTSSSRKSGCMEKGCVVIPDSSILKSLLRKPIVFNVPGK